MASHSAATPAKRFTHDPQGSSSSGGGATTSARLAPAQVPASILEDDQLNAAITAYLPSNYNFEIHKTVHHVRHYGSTCVALQMPEGLTLWATAISDIIERFTDATTVIMGDVTYGACCVDDFTARALGADMLVHYGHSCLVPVDQTSIRTLYVFVEIAVDPVHLCATVRSNFPADKQEFHQTILRDYTPARERAKVAVDMEQDDAAAAQRKPTHFALVATVQFINALQGLKEQLEQTETQGSFDDAGRRAEADGSTRLLAKTPHTETIAVAASRTTSWHAAAYKVTIPQAKPLSAGEVLGCTSPRLPDDVDGIIYVGDGRFHLESIMIANPRLPAFRYDPYEKRFVHEGYDHALMRANRSNAITTAKHSLMHRSGNDDDDVDASSGWGLILGTLGRQGSTRVLAHLRSMLAPTGIRSVPILLSELSPQKLALFGPTLRAFVQTSCPRLSIDWGDAFTVPLLSPYEAAVALGKTHARWQAKMSVGYDVSKTAAAAAVVGDEDDYPMDFYSDNSRGPWTPRHGMGVRKGNAKGISNRELLKRGGVRRNAAAATAGGG